jgi:prophage antirepressor-like protein
VSAGIERFEFPVTGQTVRTVNVGGEPYFVTADVTAILGYTNGRDAVAKHVDTEDKGVAYCDTPGGLQRVTTVNESGLYALIFGSKLAAAKAFKRWVTSEVLPAIHRTGSYAVPSAPAQLSPRELAQLVIVEADRADAAEARAAELAPAADAWQVLASGDGDYSVADAAKILSRDPQIKIGRDRLFRVLDEANWIFRQQSDGKWRTYQTAINAGRLSEIPQSHYHPRTGELVLDPPQVRVTPKGITDLRALLGGTVPLAISSDSKGL